LIVSQPDPGEPGVADITYIRLRCEFVYLAIVMDVFTRIIRGWHLGRSLDHRLTQTALDKALAKVTSQIHHSDQGVQYAATDYVQTLHQAEVAVSMAEVGQAWQNGYAERVIRTIKSVRVAQIATHFGEYFYLQRSAPTRRTDAGVPRPRDRTVPTPHR
jgi:transposase InsO family protein